MNILIFVLILELPEKYKGYNIYEPIDLLNTPYTNLFSVNDELIIELNTNEIFHGEFIEGGKNRIDIINVKCLKTNNKLSGTYSFYRNEIERIRYLEQVSEIPQPVEDSSNIKLDKSEYFRLRELIKNYVFVEENCLLVKTYSDAVESLSKVEQIGVAAPGILNRNPSIPLLVLSTWNEIYIFDTLKLVPPYFLPKLKEIFESENICKIVHKGGPLLDILQRYYNVVPNYVFDTEVVDLMIQKHNKPDKNTIEFRNIFKCLETYLNFPTSLNENFKVKPEKWQKRPLKESKMVYASQLVAYLITLKDTLDDILLTDLHKTVDNFCDYYDNITSDYDYSMKCNIKELTPDMQELIADAQMLSIQ